MPLKPPLQMLADARQQFLKNDEVMSKKYMLDAIISDIINDTLRAASCGKRSCRILVKNVLLAIGIPCGDSAKIISTPSEVKHIIERIKAVGFIVNSYIEEFYISGWAEDYE